jgi:hypothetical protein
MPLFRFHRGNLSESLETTIIIKDILELMEIIKKSYINYIPLNIDNISLTIEPYPSEKNNFDSRIGWYTQMVASDAYEKGRFIPEGFLSEPL